MQCEMLSQVDLSHKSNVVETEQLNVLEIESTQYFGTGTNTLPWLFPLTACI